MAKKPVVKELFYIRVFACLTVVLIHSITQTITNTNLAASTAETMRTLQVFMMYATPLFVLISEFLLAYSYSDHIPKKFFSKRIKFILIPYISMGIFYAFVAFIRYDQSFGQFINSASEIVLFAKYHGYFILIIFQFYLLHVYGRKLLNALKPTPMIIFSFAINIAFLYVVNFIEPPKFYNAEFYWYEVSRLMFPGWIFYFTVAYYTGKNYTVFKEKLFEYKWLVMTGFVLSIAWISYMQFSGNLIVTSSKRIDMTLYTVMIFFVLFLLSSYAKRVILPVKIISQFSFGIYLLHPFFQQILNVVYLNSDFRHFVFYTAFTFIGSIVGAILITYALNIFPYGKYVVGNVPVKSVFLTKNLIKKPQEKEAS